MSAAEIAHNLETRAKAIGLSIEEMCRRADNLAPTTFRRMRSGETSPRYETIEKLESVLDEAEAAKAAPQDNGITPHEDAHG